MIDLHGRVAVITGVADSRGQGAATARRLAELGASVVLSDIKSDETELRAKEIEEAGGRAISVHADVRSEDDVVNLYQQASEAFGRIDILHSQAADLRGLGDPGDPDLVNSTVEIWRRQFETIALGSFLTCKHVIPFMKKNDGGGSIICTTSISGLTGEAGLTTYGSAKAAVNQLVRSVAAQYGKYNIRCNAVAPGLVLTPPALDLGQAAVDVYVKHSALPHVADPEDIANIVAFLASDVSRAITGEVIRADSGVTAHTPLLADTLVLE
ncbi:SDR family NAD(P)-dependent oxidoreductase [Williamsia limnetica]|nr:SDR family oxidoreductase [Williamsia limnetica]